MRTYKKYITTEGFTKRSVNCCGIVMWSTVYAHKWEIIKDSKVIYKLFGSKIRANLAVKYFEKENSTIAEWERLNTFYPKVSILKTKI